MVSTDDAIAWALNNPGERLEYARGYLPGIDGVSQDKEQIESKNLAQFLFQSGLVELVQKREGPFDYHYYMIARTESAKKNRLRFWYPTKVQPYAKQIQSPGTADGGVQSRSEVSELPSPEGVAGV